jgi:hypothetical protein
MLLFAATATQILPINRGSTTSQFRMRLFATDSIIRCHVRPAGREDEHTLGEAEDCHDASASAVEAIVCERREHAACRRRDSVRIRSGDTSDAVALTARTRASPDLARAEQAAGTRRCTNTVGSFPNGLLFVLVHSNDGGCLGQFDAAAANKSGRIEKTAPYDGTSPKLTKNRWRMMPRPPP